MFPPLVRILLVARHTAGEASRQKYPPVAAALAGGVAAMSLALRALDFGASELKFIADIGFGALFLFGSVLAVVLTTHLFFSEIENRTALTMLARPLRRWEFLTGKLLGVWTLLALLAVAVLTVTGAILFTRHGEMASLALASGAPAPALDHAGFALFAALQLVRLGVVAALTLFVCTYARSPLFAYGAAFALLFAGQTLWLGREWAASRPEAGFAALRFALAGLPDLQAFNLGDALVFPKKAAPYAAALRTLPYGLLWIAALTALGARLFRHREI